MDILCVGELLVDFIGAQHGKTIATTNTYNRFLGGSTANLAVNANKIGLAVDLAASVGDDGLGKYLLDELTNFGLSTAHITKIPNQPTSLVFVTKSNETPDFVPVRGADAHISEPQINDDLINKAKVFHTSCFALSQEPARSIIMDKATKASILGCKLSIDINYAAEIWSNKTEAIDVIKIYCSLNPLVKISEDDAKRLFGDVASHSDIFSLLHSYGANVVCLTLGSEGAMLAHKGKDTFHKPAIKINKAVDVTGAGDAFWSGFLYGYIKNHNLEQCISFGLKLAHIKLQHVGPIPEFINLANPKII